MKLAIPTTVEEMQASLADPKTAAQIIENGQLPDFMREYARMTDNRGELRDMVIEAVKSTMAAQSEIAEQVDARVEETVSRLLRDHGVNRPQLGVPTPGLGAEANAAPNPLAPGVKMNGLGFVNIGDFARTIWHRNQQPDDRLAKAHAVMNDYRSSDPSAGGFLIPETMRSEIMQLSLEESIIRPRATVITMSGGTLSMPYVDATTNVGSVFGGMVFYWTPEAGDIEISQAKFGRVKLDPNKLTGAGAVPNELWSDAPALSSWLTPAMGRGIAFFEDIAFFTGDGADKPLGLLNSPARVVVAKESGQADDTILVENVLNMYSRMLPSSHGNAVWIANQTTFTQLMTLSIAVGTGGNAVNLVDITASPRPTLLGRPLILTEKVPTLGEEADLGFYDLSYYLIGDRQAVSIETSEHARFLSDETLLRVIERVDGRPWVQNPFQPLNGATVSPFVVLGERDGA